VGHIVADDLLLSFEVDLRKLFGHRVAALSKGLCRVADVSQAVSSGRGSFVGIIPRLSRQLETKR
jgi:hypothetical protein